MTNSLTFRFHTAKSKSFRPTRLRSKDGVTEFDNGSIKTLWGSNFKTFKGCVLFGLNFNTAIKPGQYTMSVNCEVCQLTGNLSEYVAPEIEDADEDVFANASLE